MTVTDVRTTLQAVVEAHATHNTWYSIWSVAKDRDSELTYPCVIWDQWRSRLDVDENSDVLVRTVLVRLAVITTVPTDRTQAERDAAVEAADNAAADFILKLRADYADVLTVGNVSMGTMFDDGSVLETGVLLTFSLTGQGLCLDEDTFNPPADCPTLCELLASAEWATVKACLTPEALEDAEADICTIAEDATARMVDSLDTELDSQTVAPGGTVTLIAPDVLILQSNSEPGIPVGTTPAGSVYPLPVSVIQYYEDDGGLTYTEDYDTLFIGPQVTPSQTIPARDLLNTADEVVGDRKITLVDLINNTVPQCPVTEIPSLCEQIAAGTAAEVSDCIRSSGKRPAVLADLIPTVDEADTVAQVFDVMTPGQQDLFDVTVQLVNSIGGNIGAPDVYAPGTVTDKTAPNGNVSLESVPISSVLSGGADALVKTDVVDAVKVSGATEPQKNAVYKDNGVVSGRTSYAALPNHTIAWNGTQYDLVDIFTGIDWQTTNSPADPWSGTWVELPGATPIVGTVAQATIQDLCTEPALFDIQFAVNGIDGALVTNIDPSVANTININIS